MYIVVLIIALAFVAFFIFYDGPFKKKDNLSKLSAIAFVFILAGLFFSENRFLGYGLIGTGIIIAIIDIIQKLNKRGDKRE